MLLKMKKSHYHLSFFQKFLQLVYKRGHDKKSIQDLKIEEKEKVSFRDNNIIRVMTLVIHSCTMSVLKNLVHLYDEYWLL